MNEHTLKGSLFLLFFLSQQGVLEPQDLAEDDLLQPFLNMLNVLFNLQVVAVDLLEDQLLQSSLQQVKLGIHEPVNLGILGLDFTKETCNKQKSEMIRWQRKPGR